MDKEKKETAEILSSLSRFDKVFKSTLNRVPIKRQLKNHHRPLYLPIPKESTN